MGAGVGESLFLKVQLACWRRQGGKNSPWPWPQEYELLAHICVGQEAEKRMFSSILPFFFYLVRAPSL